MRFLRTVTVRPSLVSAVELLLQQLEALADLLELLFVLLELLESRRLISEAGIQIRDVDARLFELFFQLVTRQRTPSNRFGLLVGCLLALSCVCESWFSFNFACHSSSEWPQPAKAEATSIHRSDTFCRQIMGNLRWGTLRNWRGRPRRYPAKAPRQAREVRMAKRLGELSRAIAGLLPAGRNSRTLDTRSDSPVQCPRVPSAIRC